MSTIFFVGPKMIYCRKTAGLKVAEMSALLELDKDEYFVWEMSQCDPPLKIIYKIARSFNVPLEDLLDDDLDLALFELKYDHFHFAEFREKYVFFKKFIEKNHLAKKLCIDDFIKPRRYYSEKEKADVYYD